MISLSPSSNTPASLPVARTSEEPSQRTQQGGGEVVGVAEQARPHPLSVPRSMYAHRLLWHWFRHILRC